MFKYTAKEIAGHLCTHYQVDEEYGTIIEVFGWTNNGVDNLREALYVGIGYKLNFVRQQAKKTNTNLVALVGTWFKTRSVREAIKKATEASTKAEDYVATLEALLVRIKEATDLPSAERPKYTRYAKVSDALMDECRRYITISLLRQDNEYEINSPLIVWNTDSNKYYNVEDDFSISTWRVGIAGYKNKVVGRDVTGIKVSYYMYNLETDGMAGQASYDAETGNFERNWNYYTNGVYIPQGEVYYANIEDAVKIAKAGIKALNKKNRATIKAANEKLVALAA